MKKVLYLSLALLLTTLLIECKENAAEFSPGASDPRVMGTWRLVERRFQVNVDSTLIDSIFVKAHYERDSITLKDSVFKPDYYKKTLVTITKSVDTTKYYSAAFPQTITFGTDGKLTANGSEMSYYYPIKYFRVDSTSQDGLGISLFITTNRATVPFRQGVAFQGDRLVLLPRCARLCYSKFVRVN